jgi:hypothetical protein
MNTIVRRSPAMMRRTLLHRLPHGRAARPIRPARARYVTVIVAVICGWIEQW